MADYQKISQSLDELLKSVDLSNTTEEGVKQDLPDGYYLCQVDKAQLGESKNGHPMFTIEYLTTEDGKRNVVDEEGYAQLEDAKGTANKKIFVNYVLSNEQQITFFVSDMLKFTDLDSDTPFFTKDDFLDTTGIVNVAEALTNGGIIYIMVQTVESQKEPGQFIKKYKPITWKRARKLELI